MRVDDIIPLNEHYHAHRGDRVDAEPENDGNDRLTLVSRHFFYFGRAAIDISEIPSTHLDHPFEKSGPGHRCDFSEEFVTDLAKGLKTNFKVGVYGIPCKPHSDLKLPKCPTKVRRMGCTA